MKIKLHTKFMNKNNTLSFYYYYLILLLTDFYDNGTLIKKSTTYIYIFYLRPKLYSKHISNIKEGGGGSNPQPTHMESAPPSVLLLIDCVYYKFTI
jgi:hypothetical protein